MRLETDEQEECEEDIEVLVTVDEVEEEAEEEEDEEEEEEEEEEVVAVSEDFTRSLIKSLATFFKNSRASKLKACRLDPTLFRLALAQRAEYECGLRSLANTTQPLLHAGIANGPTPANMSTTTSPRFSSCTTRLCSV